MREGRHVRGLVTSASPSAVSHRMTGETQAKGFSRTLVFPVLSPRRPGRFCNRWQTSRLRPNGSFRSSMGRVHYSLLAPLKTRVLVIAAAFGPPLAGYGFPRLFPGGPIADTRRARVVASSFGRVIVGGAEGRGARGCAAGAW